MMFFAAVPVQAETHRIEERCRIAADPALSLAQALKRLDACDRPAPDGHQGTFWVDYRAIPIELEAGKTWRLALDSHRGRAVDVWLLSAEGAPQRFSYDPQSRDREWAAGNYFSFLMTPQHTVTRMVVRLEDADSYSYVRRPKIGRAREFGPAERNQSALYGVGIGMLALTILFHLSLFFAIRRRFQLIYCVHVGLLLIYGLCYSGLIRIVLPDLGAESVSRLLGFAMAAATASVIAFVVEFLGTGIPRWLRRWALVAASGSAIAAVALAVAPSPWCYAVYLAATYIAIHAILLTAVILAVACLRRVPSSGILAAAWVLPIIISLMYPARTLGLISDGMLPDGLMMLATTIECLLLSLPVASRIRNLRIEHERAHERHVVLERQAQTDVLTGLANRRGFADALSRVTTIGTEPVPLALLVIDIDHFKRVNDVHGHAAGDLILRHVAAHVARVAGSGAIVARYGGEEFVVALRGHDLMKAATIAERIRASIGVTFDIETDLPRVTISIGAAAGLSDEIEDLLTDADSALYRAKNEGRNRVMLADGPLVYAAAA